MHCGYYTSCKSFAFLTVIRIENEMYRGNSVRVSKHRLDKVKGKPSLNMNSLPVKKIELTLASNISSFYIAILIVCDLS